MTDIDRTLSHIRASVQRADLEGVRSLSLSIQDLKELLPYMESGIYKAQVEKRMKPAGWVDPESLQHLRGGGGNSIKLRRRKSLRCNTEVYFCDALGEKVRQIAAAQDAHTSGEPGQAPVELSLENVTDHFEAIAKIN